MAAEWLRPAGYSSKQECRPPLAATTRCVALDPTADCFDHYGLQGITLDTLLPMLPSLGDMITNRVSTSAAPLTRMHADRFAALPC